MIQALGLSPRAQPTRPTAPATVVGLTAAVLEGGTIRLTFKRGGNRASAIFQIERSLDGGETWGIVASTQRTRATLTGYSPGLPMLFRVTTTNSVGTSLPSATVGVSLGKAESVALKLAA